MNKNWILSHLREAQEELQRTLVEIEARSDYDENDFEVAISHIYHHLNTAWNSRNADAERAYHASTEDFYAWRAFPSDIDMGG